MGGERKYIGNWRPHCSLCGRFIGKEGVVDIVYDSYMGGYEEGDSMCANCVKKKAEERKRRK